MASTPAADERRPACQPRPSGVCAALFGTFSAWLGQSEIAPTAFPRPKALQLFKLILLQPDHQLHRDQALDVFWSHLTGESATAQLYKALHHVRQALATANPPSSPAVLLELRDEMIRLVAPGGVHTDVAAFEELAREALRSRDLRHLQRAVACYKGNLLPADRFEEWTLAPRERLRERFIDLLVALGSRCEDAGYLAEAADALRQALERDALREDAHRGLMRVYALQGSRTRALRQYQRCTAILAEELGVEPAVETSALYEEIVQGEVHPQQPAHALPALELPLLPPLIDRQAEREILVAHLQRLEQGQGGVLALEGSAGIGKTRLAQEVVQMGARRWHVLWGGTHEQEGQTPYMPFIEALRKAVRADARSASLIPAELAVAIPELPPDALPVATADRVAAQSALFAGVLRFLATLAARTPLVLILDDLHAADPGTLKLFHYLAREAAHTPMLLVGIWRTDEPERSPTFEQMTGNLERQELLQRVALAPLSEDEHHRLLEQTLEGERVDPALAGALYRISSGNPLFAREIVRRLASGQHIAPVDDSWQFTDEPDPGGRPATLPIPSSVQALVSSRLERLSPAALRTLQFAAVAGREIPMPLLEAWSTLDAHQVVQPTLLDVLDDAVAAGLLEEQGFSYRFSHPVFRQAIYQQMSNTRRRVLHEQTAAGLERAFAADRLALPVEAVAFHYLQSGDVERAVHYLRLAGDRAESVFDHDSAAGRYEEALSLLDERHPRTHNGARAELYERLGDVHRAVGNVSGSLDAYRQALAVVKQDEGEGDGQRGQRRTLHRKITHAAVLAPDVPVAAQHLEQAWALLDEDGLEKARTLITQALFDWHANQLQAAIEHATQALAIAEREGAVVEESQACEMLAMSHLPLGHWEQGLRYELRRQTPDWSPEIVVAVEAHLCLYQFRLQGSEPFQQVRNFIQRVAHKASTIGNLRCLGVCHYVLGSLAVLQGKPETAMEQLEASLALHRRIGSASGIAYTLARQAALLTAAGDLDGGWERVEQGLVAAEQAAVRDHCLMLTHAAGIWNRLADDDLAAAGALVQAAETHDAEAAACAVCSVDRYTAMAAYYVTAGEPARASQYTEQALQLADYAHNRLGRARVLQVQGQLHAEQQALSEAEACLAEAAAIFEALDDHYDLARTYQIWGKLPPNGEKGRGGGAGDREAQRWRLQTAQQLLAQFQLGDEAPGDD